MVDGISMNRPTIEKIETTPFRLPLLGTLKWGKHSALNEVCHVLVRVWLSDGSSGVAEAPPRPTIYGETVQSIVSVIEAELGPRIVGCAGDTAQIWQRLDEVKSNHTAKAAIDMALHHALVQSSSGTILELLGHPQASARSIKVSYILGIGDRDEMLAEAARVFAAGVRVFKVKVGRNWDEDLARIGELQTTFGPALTMYADANECFLADDAAAKLSQLAEHGLLYCEEPLPIEQIAARSALRSGEHLPIIADDSTFTVRDLTRELAFDTFDILNIKPARTGYTASLQMLDVLADAEDHSDALRKGVMIGSQASARLGTARAATIAAMPAVQHPSELSFFLKLGEDIVADPLRIEDGLISIVDLLRVQVDEDLLRDAAVL